MTMFDQRTHKTEKESEQQCSDMAAVDIGIGHDDDLVIAELIKVEFLADARADRRDDGLELVVADDLVLADLLDIEHLVPQRQDGLMAAVAAFLGRAACGITLDDVDFGCLLYTSRCV